MMRDLQHIGVQIAGGRNQAGFGLLFDVAREQETSLAESDAQDQRLIVVGSGGRFIADW